MSGPPADIAATDRIEPATWMRWRETADVMAAITAGGAAARFVGGCVRDTLLKRPVKDVDIATTATPETILKLLGDAAVTAIPTGIDHGTVTAVVNKKHFEITTLRVDVETFGRHATVAYTEDWAADAARRDFTMNALFLDLEGSVFDPVGGLADLRAGHVRFVGDPTERIREDYLRVLRFFRFHAHYGSGDMDPPGLAACRDQAANIARLSVERVREELLRLLSAKDPLPTLRTMTEAGVLAVALPEGADLDRLAGLVAVDAEIDPLRRLMALLPSDRTTLSAFSTRLKLSRAQSDRLEASVPPLPSSGLSKPEAQAMLYCIGLPAFQDRTLLAWAALPKSKNFKPLLALASTWKIPSFPLRGADLLDLGVPSGPRVGEIMRDVEQWWIAGDFKAGRQACLKEARSRL